MKEVPFQDIGKYADFSLWLSSFVCDSVVKRLLWEGNGLHLEVTQLIFYGRKNVCWNCVLFLVGSSLAVMLILFYGVTT